MRGNPRAQYKRTYVLIPQTYGPEWAEAAARATWGKRFTIGYSADDAGIGDLDYRRVIAVNPGAWSGDLLGFFETYYPSVEYIPIEASSPELLLQKLAEFVEDPKPEPPTFPILGIHGRGGGEYLVSRGVRGWCLVPTYIGTSPATVDFRDLAAAGIRVVLNIRRGWSTDCGGEGTLPPRALYPQFVDAVLGTLFAARGIWGATLLNEPNNSREWPIEGGQVTVSDVIEVYNEVWQRKPGAIRLGPGALDPFHGQTGSPLDWWVNLLGAIDGADFLALHGYTRGPSLARFDDLSRFSDSPMEWQYANFPWCTQTFVDTIPTRFAHLPRIVTEYSHLWLEDELWPKDPTCGWSPDAADVIEEARRRAIGLGMSGLMVYRMTGDAWAIADKPKLLEKIVELNR